jgi:hypothetical protein
MGQPHLGVALFTHSVQCLIMRARTIILMLGLVCAACLVVAVWLMRSTIPSNPLIAGSGSEVVVFDTSMVFALDPPPAGWRHRKFWLTPPMQLSFTTKEATSALRCETNASGSIYGRHTDIDIARFPVLTWRWFVELPISSERDERMPEGDDHPVRFFLKFRDSEGGSHQAEIIWANRAFKRGDWKYIGKFPHYVADGGSENVGRWRHQRAHLLNIYRNITKRSDTPRLVFLALFCDSDNTGGRSVAYTADVRLVER